MPIARMLGVNVFGHDSVVDQTVDLLQRAGVLEITHLDAADFPDKVGQFVADETDLARAEERVAHATFVVSFLGRFHVHEAPFSTFVSEKIHLGHDEYCALVRGTGFAQLYEECEQLADKIAMAQRETARLEELIERLRPWQSLALEISRWKGTEHTILFAGTVPVDRSEEIRQLVRDASDLVTVEEVGSHRGRQAWIVMTHKDRSALVADTLRSTDFSDTVFPDLFDTPAEEIERARRELDEMREVRALSEARAQELADEHWSTAVARVQRFTSELNAIKARERFVSTERAFALRGWLPERDRGVLEEALSSVSGAISLEFFEPTADDVVPVELENSPLIKPFEVLTDLYGRPRYGAFDPTPVMAPFFFLFFGMCLGDVGYGLMLIAGAWWVKHKLDVAAGVRRFMDLLIMGGAASILWGFVTRGFLAFRTEWLPSFLRYQPLIDPESELMLLLGICVAIGVVHVSIGTALGFVEAWRSGRRLEAIGDSGSALLFVWLLVAGILGFLGVVPSAAGAPLITAAFVQLVLLKGGLLPVLAGRKPVWQLVLIPFKGALGLYGMIGYGSDFLSYTRLAALGLAGMYVGDAMNRLSELSWTIPGVGVVVAALIFVVGHVFNVVINLLGAFVHPTRLQFVEFFGKFYEGGGKPLEPFALNMKQLVIEPRPLARATSRKEGSLDE